MNTDIAAQRALDRLADGEGRSLSDYLNRVLAGTGQVWTPRAGVGNRGFAGYFSSSAGDIAFHAPSALRVIGAVGKAEIAARANNVFGAGGPPRDRKKRRAIVRTFNDETRRMLQGLETLFYESQEDVDDLLEVYLDNSP